MQTTPECEMLHVLKRELLRSGAERSAPAADVGRLAAPQVGWWCARTGQLHNLQPAGGSSSLQPPPAASCSLQQAAAAAAAAAARLQVAPRACRQPSRCHRCMYFLKASAVQGVNNRFNFTSITSKQSLRNT